MRVLKGLLAALFAAPMALGLASAEVTERHPLLAPLAALAIGLLVAGSVAGLARGRSGPRVSHRAGLIAVALLALGYGAALSLLHLQHHRNLGTATWDLGIYVNTLWHSARGDLFACTLLSSGTDLTAHFEPSLLLFAPLMWSERGVELLLVAQAFWIGLAAVPLYLLAREALEEAWACAGIAAAWLLHPAVHGANLFDFHTLSLVGLPIFAALWCLERGRSGGYAAALLLLLGMREDMSLLAAGIGLWALARGGRARIGIATLAFAIAWFAVVKLYLMTEGESYASYFADLQIDGKSIYASILQNLLERPLFVLRHALAVPKVAYLLQLAVPLLLLPLLAGRRWLMLAYGLAVLLLASKPAVFDIGFQYSNFLLPFLFAAAPPAIAGLGRGRLASRLALDARAVTAALGAGILAASLAMSARYGVFVPNDSFEAGGRGLQRSPGPRTRARSASVQRARALVPGDAAVVVSGRLGPHFSMRDRVWQFKKVQKREEVPDYYVVLASDARGAYEAEKLAGLRESAAWSLVFDENGVMVFGRRSP